MIEKVITYVVSLLMKEQLINEDEVDKYIYGYTYLSENIIHKDILKISNLVLVNIYKNSLLFRKVKNRSWLE